MEAEYGEKDDIIRDASEATRKLNHQPLVEQSTIRHWMYAVDGTEEYWTDVIEGKLSFDHLEKAAWLERHGWIAKCDALDWALANDYTTADQMKAHFCNPTEETKEQRTTRRIRSTISQLRQLFEAAEIPPEKAEAVRLIQKGIELWETSSKKS